MSESMASNERSKTKGIKCLCPAMTHGGERYLVLVPKWGRPLAAPVALAVEAGDSRYGGPPGRTCGCAAHLSGGIELLFMCEAEFGEDGW